MPALATVFRARLRAGAQIVAAAALGGVAMPSGAAQCPAQETRCVQAEEIVRLLGYESTLAQLRRSCIRGLAVLHPDRGYSYDPDAFFGLTPANGAWPRIVTAFETFREEACGDKAFGQSLLERYRTAWQANLSERGMLATLRFLRSERGREFGQALVNVHRVVSEEYEHLDAELRPRALDRYRRHVQQIARDALTK